ncbi:MAG TPA: aldo/keto reductase [Candidatus Paceibacterota bacterium]|nr:aldo/keto reductase [Candidatus Paceibacterota bacterium]
MARDVAREIEMNTGEKMPVIGFGTWNLAGRAEQPVLWALEAGYRHIDTAKIYDTETDIGRAVKKSGVPREEIFITTKLWDDDQGYERAIRAIDASLDRLGMDYVDLYLIHWPNTDEPGGKDVRAETWRAMEHIFRAGKARTIGVSNYERSHLAEMELYAEMPPAVNQVEMHPFKVPNDTVEYCHEHGIIVVNYSPLTRTQYFGDETLNAIEKKHGKTVPQVLLRWGV